MTSYPQLAQRHVVLPQHPKLYALCSSVWMRMRQGVEDSHFFPKQRHVLHAGESTGFIGREGVGAFPEPDVGCVHGRHGGVGCGGRQ